MINLNKTDVPGIDNIGLTTDEAGVPMRWDLPHATYLYLFPETLDQEEPRTVALEIEISREDNITEALKKVVCQVTGDVVNIDLTRRSILNQEDPEVLEYQEFLLGAYKELRRIYGIQDSIEEIRAAKLREISEYDSGEEVNSFYYGDLRLWLDKSTRVGLMNSTSIQKDLGLSECTLWLGSVSVTLPVDNVIEMLQAIEVYALTCYNVTTQHRYNINSLGTIEEILGYDYTTGYPEKLRL